MSSDEDWWSFRQVVAWIRANFAAATASQVAGELQSKCVAGRIRSRGRRRIYKTKLPRADVFELIILSDQMSEVAAWSSEIAAGEWHDLVVFGRPVPVIGEPYLTAVERALERDASPIELLSISQSRLAWVNPEFARADVLADWMETSRGLDGRCEEAFADRRTRSLERPRAQTHPVSDRKLSDWYQERVAALQAAQEFSSGEADWMAAQKRFGLRVTRKRVRDLREKHAPKEWQRQGRRAVKPAQ